MCIDIGQIGVIKRKERDNEEMIGGEESGIGLVEKEIELIGDEESGIGLVKEEMELRGWLRDVPFDECLFMID